MRQIDDGAARKLGLDAFKLKIIAILAMTCNHTAHVFLEAIPMYVLFPLYVVGGITFPIMAYFIVEGYKKTSNVRKYMLRMLIFALIALFPFVWALATMLNVLFTLLLGIVCLYLRDHMKSRVRFGFCFAGITLVTIFCDWSLIGVLMIFLYGTVNGERLRIILPPVTISAICLVYVIISNIADFGPGARILLMDGGFALAGLAVIPLLSVYNGNRGYSPPALRYLFYIYYPAHLLLLAGIKWLAAS